MSDLSLAIDLAKNVFELAVADESGAIVERRRLGRTQFIRFFENKSFKRVVMEACGSAHHWGRWFAARGFEVSLLPPHYVRAYVRRNKTDRADVTAILEAAKATDIIPVRVKSVEQQAPQGARSMESALPGRSSNTRSGMQATLVLGEPQTTALSRSSVRRSNRILVRQVRA
jgi:hypothetical protein